MSHDSDIFQPQRLQRVTFRRHVEILCRRADGTKSTRATLIQVGGKFTGDMGNGGRREGEVGGWEGSAVSRCGWEDRVRGGRIQLCYRVTWFLVGEEGKRGDVYSLKKGSN